MKRGALIYSDTCPKCRLLRAVAGALDLKYRLYYQTWRRARVGILIYYFGSREAVPYNFFFINAVGDLYEGGAAVPFIISALLGD